MNNSRKANLKFLVSHHLFDGIEINSGVELWFFIREDIPSKVISKETLSIEGMFIELNFCKKKWLLSLLTLSSLIKEPTCYKNPQNPSCIGLILTNSPYSF